MPEQLSLDWTAPRARRRDPATSHMAAARVAEFAGEHHEKILEALRVGPGTIYELGDRTDLDHVQVARRLSELEAASPPRALPTDATRPSPRGRPCRVWRLA
jgi:predicted ArsR family transcriptional regulator